MVVAVVREAAASTVARRLHKRSRQECTSVAMRSDEVM